MYHIKTSRIICICVISLVIFSGCKSRTEKSEIIFPAQDLYQNGITLLEQHKYKNAASEFGKVFLQHPDNPLTPQAEIMQAYALYLASEYDEAADVLDIFIKLHPAHPDIAYVYYLQALAYYVQISNVQLDQSHTEMAKTNFEDIILKFPGSKYAIDAALKIDLVNDHLAGKEMDIGRYYLKRKNLIAAIPRYQHVLEKYETTSHIAEALYRLAEGYKLLGLNADAQKYAAVLGHNYPNSYWYLHALKLFANLSQTIKVAK